MPRKYAFPHRRAQWEREKRQKTNQLQLAKLHPFHYCIKKTTQHIQRPSLQMNEIKKCQWALKK